eukprot:SAG31_NODE_43_length_31224_cov_10.112578_11_plen_40_part_00
MEEFDDSDTHTDDDAHISGMPIHFDTSVKLERPCGASRN